MEYTLSQIDMAVRRAYYRQYDGDGEWWWVEAVYESDLVAREDNSEKWYRVGYTFDADAEEKVTFAERDSWQEVEWEWVAVERSIMEGRKASIMSDRGMEIRSVDSTMLQTQRRSFTAEIKRANKRTTITVNTGHIDQHRTIIDPAGGDWTSAFRGKFFVNHDYDLLAGRSPVPELVGGQWVVSIDDDAWDHEDPQVERWFRKVKSGLCDEVSIGFEPVAGLWEEHEVDGRMVNIFRFTEWRGLEWSFVGMGSNPGAVVTERQAQEGRQAPETGRQAPETEQPAPQSSTTPAPVRHVTIEQLRRIRHERQQQAETEALKRLGRA